LPRIQSYYRKYAKKGLEIIAVTIEKPDKLRKFVASNGLTFPIAIDGEKETFATYAIQAIPYIYLINKVGLVVWQNFEGALDEERIQRLLKPPKRVSD